MNPTVTSCPVDGCTWHYTWPAQLVPYTIPGQPPTADVEHAALAYYGAIEAAHMAHMAHMDGHSTVEFITTISRQLMQLAWQAAEIAALRQAVTDQATQIALLTELANRD